MSSIFKQIQSNLANVLETMRESMLDLFYDDTALVSREAQKILSHPIDRKIYIDAIDKLRTMEEGEPLTIELSSGKKMTISAHIGPTFFN